jgi:hypothetical protein
MFGVRSGRAAFVALLSFFLLAVGVASASASPVTWAPPTLADPPVGGQHSSLYGISCPSASLCVAGDRFGGITTTTDPASGVWEAQSIAPGVNISAVSCASVWLCVAVGGDSTGADILTSTNPTGGAAAWTKTAVATRSLFAVDCPSANLCVAGGIGQSGQPDLLTTTDPTGGASAWHGLILSNHPVVYGVSCPTTGVCVAVGVYGRSIGGGSHTTIATSTHPTAGAGAWKVHKYGRYDIGLGGVSCPAPSLCVAVGESPKILVSKDPTGAITTWKRASPHGGLAGHSLLTGVSCPTKSLCVASSNYNFVVTSTKPTNVARGWRTDSVPGLSSGDSGVWLGVSCPTATSCVMVDRAGYATFGTAS